jgi:hypothetical protein
LLWIDAISINQKDFLERSKLVEKMSEIYGNAVRVIVDLGDEGEDSNEAMQLVEEVGKDPSMENIVTLTRDAQRISNWNALGRLMARPYWRRVWIVQEVAVAQDIVVLCGSIQTSWLFFGAAIDSLVKSFIHGGHGSFQMVRKLELDAVWAVRTVSKLFSRKNNSGKQRPGLAELLIICHNCKSSDPRDQVYGLLSLSDEPLGIQPDYLKPEDEVFAEAIKQIIKTTGSLDIFSALDYAGRPTDSRLPSWTPNFAAPSPPNFPFFKLGYRAAGCLSANSYTIWFDGNKMISSGHLVGTIDRTSSDIDFLDELRVDVLTNPQSPYRTDNERRISLFDTLQKDVRNDIQEALRVLEVETQHYSDETGPFMMWYYRRFLEEGPGSWHSEEAANGWSAIAQGRKVFISVGQHIGHVPDAAEPGDHLVVLPGGRVPFCIREVVEPLSSTTPKAGHAYHIIGDW